ncbi:hypothetical protein ACIBI9_47825 [Nonomuraea sp. NPDC050451]|uniref:hypothetical protein n=1 Tax=Nonomuraea sp. NPDC050451 TaxID=3364364 RepID=UPI0037966BF7
MRRTIAGLCLVLLLASCGWWSDRVSPGRFETRAQEVVARWDGSAADRAWRSGLVPLGGLQDRGGWTDPPAWVTRSTHNGVWKLAAELPADPLTDARVRWPDGSVSAVPLVTAADAYAEFSKPADFVEEECPAKGCRPLRVTGAELGEATVETSRGTITVPAWLFTAKGVEFKFAYVAVAPSAVTARPQAAEGETEEVTGFDLVASKPHDLLLKYGHGSCDRIHGARAYETGRLVVVDVDEEGSGGMCDLMLNMATITVTLTRPLGDRLVLDSGTGLPVVRGVTPALYGHR